MNPGHGNYRNHRSGTRNALARIDALPEHYDYRDTGCELHPACLSCPLPECVLLTPGRERTRSIHAAEVQELLARGMSVVAAAALLGISRRSAFRRLAAL